MLHENIQNLTQRLPKTFGWLASYRTHECNNYFRIVKRIMFLREVEGSILVQESCALVRWIGVERNLRSNLFFTVLVQFDSTNYGLAIKLELDGED